MKKHILLLTLFSQFFSTLSANSYSWTGFYLKASPGYSNLKLNYSGNRPYYMNIQKKDGLFPSHNNAYKNFKVADNVSAHAANIDATIGVSQEISDCIGIIGEIGSSVGGTSDFIASQDAFMMQNYIAAGLFYHQPLFRIFTMAGIGFGADIFGYPNALEKLTSNQSINMFKSGNFINATIGMTFRGTVGIDYKINHDLLLGVSYTYMRSKTTATLKNDANVYISNHAFAITIGAHF